jgi:hypothetical protein
MTAASSSNDTTKVALKMAPEQFPSKLVIVEGVEFPRDTPVKVSKTDAEKMLARTDERGKPYVVAAK